MIKHRYRLFELPNVTKMPYSSIFSIVFYSKTMANLRIHSFWWRHAFQILKIGTFGFHSNRNLGQGVIGCSHVTIKFVFSGLLKKLCIWSLWSKLPIWGMRSLKYLLIGTFEFMHMKCHDKWQISKKYQLNRFIHYILKSMNDSIYNLVK